MASRKESAVAEFTHIIYNTVITQMQTEAKCECVEKQSTITETLSDIEAAHHCFDLKLTEVQTPKYFRVKSKINFKSTDNSIW